MSTIPSVPEFPESFTWGAATAAYQIEGGWDQGGRGLSIWDVFAQTPGRTWEGDTGNEACDHFHRWREDIGLMKALGLKGYRLSLSWSRIFPEGTGRVNEAGMAFYERLVDGLLEAGIEPWITLYHWDLPYALYCRGGWLNPKSPEWFSDYARFVAERLSDRVSRWITLNEPQCFIGLGMDRGIHAPGLRLGAKDILKAAHHVLLAHGRGVQTLREYAKKTPCVGWAPVAVSAIPDTGSPADIEAARRAMFSWEDQSVITNPWDTSIVWSNTWWGDPVVFGQYPEDALRILGQDVPKFTSKEMETISCPIDFYGANVYHGIRIREGEGKAVEKAPGSAGRPRSLFGWERCEEVLYWSTRFLYERYRHPVVVTENGIACHDWVDVDGAVNDPQRIDFTKRYLRELACAIGDGVDVRGYFHWSLMDNFEWAEGFKQRFGLIHVDFATQKRTPKSSCDWYRDVIASNGRNLF